MSQRKRTLDIEATKDVLAPLCKRQRNNDNSLVKKNDDMHIESLTFNAYTLSLLCIGYVRIQLNLYNINYHPNDIGSILSEYLYKTWQWSKCLRYLMPVIISDQDKDGHIDINNDSIIETNNNNNKNQNNNSKQYKTILCQIDNLLTDKYSHLFIINEKMIPFSGIYKIKFKIDFVFNNVYNIIGIVNRQYIENQISLSQTCNKTKSSWIRGDCHYLGWTPSEMQPISHCQACNGNISDKYKNNSCEYACPFKNVKYEIRNSDFGQVMKPIEKNDIITLTYNSNNFTLLFEKENDDRSDCIYCYAHNILSNSTFYWVVGRWLGCMSITIID